MSKLPDYPCNEDGYPLHPDSTITLPVIEMHKLIVDLQRAREKLEGSRKFADGLITEQTKLQTELGNKSRTIERVREWLTKLIKSIEDESIQTDFDLGQANIAKDVIDELDSTQEQGDG